MRGGFWGCERCVGGRWVGEKWWGCGDRRAFLIRKSISRWWMVGGWGGDGRRGDAHRSQGMRGWGLELWRSRGEKVLAGERIYNIT